MTFHYTEVLRPSAGSVEDEASSRVSAESDASNPSFHERTDGPHYVHEQYQNNSIQSSGSATLQQMNSRIHLKSSNLCFVVHPRQTCSSCCIPATHPAAMPFTGVALPSTRPSGCHLNRGYKPPPS